MIICPNFSNKQVRKEFGELANAVGETAAYDIWSLNNGNSIDKAPNGAESKLFADLLSHYNGDRTKAIQAKAKVYSKSFKTWFGDWVLSANNPFVHQMSDFLTEDEIGEIIPNWESYIKALDLYHNSKDESYFKNGRETLSTRVEKHFPGEGHTIDHIRRVTESMIRAIDGVYSKDVPLLKDAAKSMLDKKKLLILAAMFHDAAKPYHHGDIHGWESADILREMLKDSTGYELRLAEWAVRHHMPNPFSHQGLFSIKEAELMAKDAMRLGIGKDTAINAFLLINSADIINGRDLSENDKWATKLGYEDPTIRGALNKELAEKKALLEQAFENVKDFEPGDTVENWNNQIAFDYKAFPEGGDRLPWLSEFRVSLGKRLKPSSERGLLGERDVRKFEVLDESGKVIGNVQMEFNPKLGVTLHPQLNVSGKGYGLELYKYIAKKFNVKVFESYGEIPKSEAAKKMWKSMYDKGVAKYMFLDDDFALRYIEHDNGNQVSKVVDENGEPLMVYHGNSTDTPIIEFDKEKVGTQHENPFKNIDGFWFLTDRGIAKSEYALKPESVGRGALNLLYGELLPVFLNIKNPLRAIQKGIRKMVHPEYGFLFTETDEKFEDFMDRVDSEFGNTNDGIVMEVVDKSLDGDDYRSQQTQMVVTDSNQVKSIDNEGLFSESGNIYHQTKENETFIPRSFLTHRLFMHLELALARLFPDIKVLKGYNLPEGEFGRIDTRDAEAITIMLSDNYNADTLPHEYAHRYIEMFRNTPIVQKAIAKYGSEEALVQAIGEQATRQIGDAYSFWRKLWEYVKAIFSKEPFLKKAIQIDLTNAFLQNRNLGKNSSIINQVREQGLIYFQKKKVSSINEARAILQKLSNLISFNEELHKYTNVANGDELKSVSSYKLDLLYSVYDDSDLSENQTEYNDNSRAIGTAIHAVMESLFKGTFKEEAFTKPIYAPDGKLKRPGLSKKALDNLVKLHALLAKDYEFVASEALVADFEAKVAGTIDLVLKNKKTGKFGIFDFKTKCILLDGSRENKDGKHLWGFSYVNKTKTGAKTQTNAYDFQLGTYLHILDRVGFNAPERGIIPIVYEFNTKTGMIGNSYLSKKMGSFDIDPNKGVYEIVPQTAVKNDIETKVFGEESDTYDNEYIQSRTKAFTEIILNIVKSLSNKAMIDKMQGRRSQAKQLNYVVDLIGNASEVEAMLKYVQAATDQLSRVFNQIDLRYKREGLKKSKAIDWSLPMLKNYNELALSFNMINDILGFILRYRASLTNEEFEAIQKGLLTVSQLLRNIMAAYKDVGSRIYMDAISGYVKNVEANYRELFEREYKSEHSSQKIDLNEMLKYIDNKIESMRDLIDEEERTWLRRQMEVADNLFECNWLSSLFGTVFQSKDPFVQASVKFFDETMQKVDHDFIAQEREMLRLVDEFEKKYNVGNLSNHRNAYDDFIEIIDGQAYLVNDIPNSFILAEAKMYNDLNQDYSLTFELRAEAIEKWYDENAPIVDKKGLLEEINQQIKDILADVDEKKVKEILKGINDEKKPKSIAYYYKAKKYINTAQLDEIQLAQRDLILNYRIINTTKFPNTRYDNMMRLAKTDDVKYRLWAKFREMGNLGDSGIPRSKLLANRLPGIRKTAVERVSENKVKGIKDSVINWTKENSMLVEDDTMQGQAFTDMNGNVVKLIPVYYNGRLTLDDQSFDLPTIYARWLHSAMESQAKIKMEDYLLVTSEILKERSVLSDKATILSKLKGGDEKAKYHGEYTYNQFVKWMDLVIYGNKITDSGNIGKYSVDKIAQSLMKFRSLQVMGVNYISMINNLTVAELNQVIEAFGNDYSDLKSYNKASVLYLKHLKNGSMLADIGKRAPEDFVNQLSEWFGIFDDGDPNLRANGISRAFTTDAAFWTTNMGEHIAQSRFLLSTLYKLKAKDKNGNELGDMIDFLSFDENGQLKVDEKVVNFDLRRQAEFGMGVRSVLMSMHGNYTTRYVVALLQYALGKMALMFRKWIFTSFARRFQKRYYDNIRGEWVEGYHTTSRRLIKNIMINPVLNKFMAAIGKATDDNKLAVLKWNLLLESEKRNVIKSVTELLIIGMSFTLAQLFRAKAKDDDDDGLLSDIYMNISYQLYRVYTDLTFYFNPWSFTQIVQDPFPVMAAIDNVGRLFDRLWHPMDVYTTGKNKGENKLLYSIGQMVPVWRQIPRFENIQYEYDFLSGKN